MPYNLQVIRACLLYEYKLGSNAADTTRRVNIAFGEDAIKERTVRKWFQKFRSGDEMLEDAPRCGRPASIDVASLKDAIASDSQQSCNQLALDFGVCKETIRRHKLILGK